MAWVGQQCVIVVFSDQTPHYLIVSYIEAQIKMNNMKKNKGQFNVLTMKRQGI